MWRVKKGFRRGEGGVGEGTPPLQRMGRPGFEGVGTAQGGRRRTKRRSPGLGLSWDTLGLDGLEAQRLVPETEPGL